MFCAVRQRRFSEFSAALEDAAIRERIPIMGAMELTYRCNLSCCHCYCNLRADDPRAATELTTAEACRVIDEAAAAGCLWMLLTGGEVLVRPDFREIYLHALRRGMIVEVFTNATLIDEETARLFADYPPFGVDISVYGSYPELHDRITGVPGSFRKMREGLDRLRAAGVGFSLKTILMTLNFADLGGIMRLADTLGARFHYDTLISPRTDGGGTGPAAYRLDAGRMAGCDLDDEKDYKESEDVFRNFWRKDAGEPQVCGGGVFAFNIDPYGNLSPCTMYASFRHSLRDARFSEAWRRLVGEYDRARGAFVPPACRGCSMFLMCPQCPAWAEAEAGSMSARVEYLCSYAKTLERDFLQKQARRRHEKAAL